MIILPINVIKNTKCYISLGNITFDSNVESDNTYPIYLLSVQNQLVDINMSINKSIISSLNIQYPNSSIVNVTFELTQVLATGDYIEVPITLNYIELNKVIQYTIRLDNSYTIAPCIITSLGNKQNDILDVGTSVVIKGNLFETPSVSLFKYSQYAFKEVSTYETNFNSDTVINLVEPTIYKLVIKGGSTQIKYVINYMMCYKSLLDYITKINVNQLDKLFELSQYTVLINKFIYLHKLNTDLDNITDSEVTNILPDISYVLEDVYNYIVKLQTNVVITDVLSDISTNPITNYAL